MHNNVVLDALDEETKGMDDDPSSLYLFTHINTKTTQRPPYLLTAPLLCSSIPFEPRITKLGIYQYHRILKRRAARANLEAENRLLQRGRKVRKKECKEKEKKKKAATTGCTRCTFFVSSPFFFFFKHIKGEVRSVGMRAKGGNV